MKTYDTRFGPFSIADEEVWHCIAPVSYTHLTLPTSDLV